MKETLVRWNLFMPPELLVQLKTTADQHGVSSAKLVRTACEKYLVALKRAQEQQHVPANHN